MYIVHKKFILATLLLKITVAYQNLWEKFHVNSSSNNTKYLKFYGRKIKSTRNSKRSLAIIGEISGSTMADPDLEIRRGRGLVIQTLR